MQKHNVNNLKHRQLYSKSTNRNLALSLVLTDFGECNDIFVVHEFLLPNTCDSRPNYHTRKEEIIYIISGCANFYCNDEQFVLEQGEFICISPEESYHYLENTTSERVEYLKICSSPLDDEVIYK